MSICRDKIQRKVGCKKENLLANPPVLKTNFVPDENGVTDHNPDFCKEGEQPKKQPKSDTTKKVDFKNKKIILDDMYGENTKDGLRRLGGYYWNSVKKETGSDLYYVWSEGSKEEEVFLNRLRYEFFFQDDERDTSSSIFEARKAKIKIVGKSLDSKSNKNNPREAKTKAALDTKIDKFGYEEFNSFKSNIAKYIQVNKEYKDIYFNYFAPFNKQDIKDFDIADNSRYRADWDFSYHFYVQEYENSIKNRNIPVALLPNFYAWFSEIENSKSENFYKENSVKRFFDLISLDGAMPASKRDRNFPTPTTDVASNTIGNLPPSSIVYATYDVRKKTYEYDYFDQWGKSIKNVPAASKEYLKNAFTNTILTSKDLDFNKTIFNKRTLFPMTVDISFPNQSVLNIEQQFLESLEISNLMPSLMNYVILNKPKLLLNELVPDVPETIKLAKILEIPDIPELPSVPESSQIDVAKNILKDKNLSFFDNFIEQSSLFYKTKELKNSIENKRYGVWDVSKWIEMFNKFEAGKEKLENSKALEIFETDETDLTTFLGSYPLELKNRNQKAWKFFRTVMFLAFSGKIKKLIKEKNRKFSDMLTLARECHAEQVFYRIEKINLDKNEVVQNFYVANDSKEKIVQWVDSQAKYAKNYRYEVYAYNIVLATNYHYEELFFTNNFTSTPYETTTPGRTVAAGVVAASIPPQTTRGAVEKYTPPLAEFTVRYAPNFYLVETLYYSFSGKILDAPPVSPEVEFVSFINVDDTIQINMRSNTGESYEVPIAMTEQEEDYYNSLPDNLRKEDTVKFKSDDPVRRYKIYRLDKKPKNILDFVGKSQDIQTKNFASAASVLHKIMPNQKYYYMFRSVDIHEHKSNPSSIYEVEMVNDGGFSYLEVNIFKFDEEKIRIGDKKVQKNITLQPSFLQTELDLTSIKSRKSAIDSIPRVGTQKESVLDKQYKMRITSKKTGKKIDINFRYKHEHKK